jgi:hypothetical protein
VLIDHDPDRYTAMDSVIITGIAANRAARVDGQPVS